MLPLSAVCSKPPAPDPNNSLAEADSGDRQQVQQESARLRVQNAAEAQNAIDAAETARDS
jgi:hypothetical protein